VRMKVMLTIARVCIMRARLGERRAMGNVVS